jgi:guanylate kinase
LSNLLLHKPDDVFKFTKDYFSVLSDLPDLSKILVLVGPQCVGKTAYINKLIEKYPNNFEFPVKITTDTNAKGDNINKYKKVEKLEFMDVKYIY